MKITPEYLNEHYPQEEFEEDRKKCVIAINHLQSELPSMATGGISSVLAGGFFARIIRNEYNFHSTLKGGAIVSRIPVLSRGDIDIFPIGPNYKRIDYWKFIKQGLLNNYEKYSNMYQDKARFALSLDEQYQNVSNDTPETLSMWSEKNHDWQRTDMTESAHHGITIHTNAGNRLNIILDPNCVNDNMSELFNRFDMMHAKIGYRFRDNHLFGFKEAFFAAKYRLMRSNPKKQYQPYRLEKFIDEGYSSHEF